MGEFNKTIFEPLYYEQFHCLASSCPFTCCQEWKIAVDPKTWKKWKKLTPPKEILPQKPALSDYTGRIRGDRAIRLTEKGSCPFLGADKLCRLVEIYGEEVLSDTCHLFPRESHEYTDRIERYLSPGCPQMLSLLWTGESFTMTKKRMQDITLPVQTEQNTEADSHEQDSLQSHPEDEIDCCRMLRDTFAAFAAKAERPLPLSMKIIFFLALQAYQDWKEGILTCKRWKDYLQEENIRELEKTIERCPQDPGEILTEQNELFLDLIDTYQKKGVYKAFLDSLQKMAFLLEQEDPGSLLQKAPEAADAVKLWEPQLRLLVCEELQATLLQPDAKLTDLIMKLEWLALEYAALRHCLFLRFLLQKSLTKQDLLECTTILFRITGYSDDDIQEYLENSFEDLIWPWGYFALLVS